MPGIPIARASNMRARIWKAIRMMRRFTQADLLATSEASSTEVSRYTLALRRAGILSVVRPASPRTCRHGVMSLRLDLGPLTPVLRKRGRIVYDPNEHKNYEAGNG